MDHESHEIIRLVGVNAESAGRMLQRTRKLTLDDLTSLQDTLRLAGETLKIMKDIEVSNHS